MGRPHRSLAVGAPSRPCRSERAAKPLAFPTRYRRSWAGTPHRIRTASPEARARAPGSTSRQPAALATVLRAPQRACPKDNERQHKRARSPQALQAAPNATAPALPSADYHRVYESSLESIEAIILRLPNRRSIASPPIGLACQPSSFGDAEIHFMLLEPRSSPVTAAAPTVAQCRIARHEEIF